MFFVCPEFLSEASLSRPPPIIPSRVLPGTIAVYSTVLLIIVVYSLLIIAVYKSANYRSVQ